MTKFTLKTLRSTLLHDSIHMNLYRYIHYIHSHNAYIHIFRDNIIIYIYRSEPRVHKHTHTHTRPSTVGQEAQVWGGLWGGRSNQALQPPTYIQRSVVIWSTNRRTRTQNKRTKTTTDASPISADRWSTMVDTVEPLAAHTLAHTKTQGKRNTWTGLRTNRRLF